MKTYFMFTVQCYKSITPQGTLQDFVELQVVANSEDEALKKAKKVFVREGFIYRVKAVIEYQLVESAK